MTELMRWKSKIQANEGMPIKQKHINMLFGKIPIPTFCSSTANYGRMPLQQQIIMQENAIRQRITALNNQRESSFHNLESTERNLKKINN